VDSNFEQTRDVSSVIESWIPVVRAVTENQKLSGFLGKIETISAQYALFQVMDTIRTKHGGEGVPQEFAKRNDFVMDIEMQEASKMIGERYGIELDHFYEYFEERVLNRKCTLTFPSNFI
jgi:hypothetical protein